MTCGTTYKLTPKCKCGTSQEIEIKFNHKEISKTINFTCKACKTTTEATLSRRLEDIKTFTENPKRFRIAGVLRKVRNVIEYPPKEEMR